jgi:hypothetical protein
VVVAIELKFGVFRSLLALLGFEDDVQRYVKALTFPLMLVFSTFLGCFLSGGDTSLEDTLLAQGLVIILISLFRL